VKIIPDKFDFYASENGESKDKLILSLSGYGENLSMLPIVNNGSYKTESIFSILCIAAGYQQCSLSILEAIGKLIKVCVQKHRHYKILVNPQKKDLAFFLAHVAREFNEKSAVQFQEGCLDFCVMSDEKNETEAEVLWRQMKKRLAEMEKLKKEDLCKLIEDLGSLEKLAIKLFAETKDIDLKGKINAAKERALNFLYYKP
jgi:hypothetical protein